MTPSEPSGTTRGRIAAIGFSLFLLCALLFPASAIDENRSAPEPPQLTMDAVTSGAILAQLRDTLSANFGLKVFAVQLFAKAHLAAGVSPTPAVFLGDGGEPFLSEDFSNACRNDLEALDFEAMLDELEAAQHAAGRDFLFAVAPDKSSIERDRLGPSADALLACSDRNRAYLEGVPSIVTAWDEFESSDEELYLFGDSHWNYTGASRFAVEVLERVRPGIVEPGDLVKTQREYSGDLFRLMGVEQQGRVTVVSALRDGVETSSESEVTPLGYTVQRWQSSGDVELIEGRTLLVVDSAFGYNSTVYPPYFEDLTSIPIQAITDPGAIASLGDYDRVIVQRVQRSLPSDLGTLLAAPWL